MPRVLINIKGQQFGRLHVMKRDVVAGYRACSYWYCLCKCGRKQSVRSSYLRWGIITRCYDCSLSKLKKKWRRIAEEKRREQFLKEKQRVRFTRGTSPSMKVSLRKKFSPRKINDQIKEIISIRETGTAIKDIAALLEVPIEMVRDVLKHKRLHQQSVDKR